MYAVVVVPCASLGFIDPSCPNFITPFIYFFMNHSENGDGPTLQPNRDGKPRKSLSRASSYIRFTPRRAVASFENLVALANHQERLKEARKIIWRDRGEPASELADIWECIEHAGRGGLRTQLYPPQILFCPFSDAYVFTRSWRYRVRYSSWPQPRSRDGQVRQDDKVRVHIYPNQSITYLLSFIQGDAVCIDTSCYIWQGFIQVRCYVGYVVIFRLFVR